VLTHLPGSVAVLSIDVVIFFCETGTQQTREGFALSNAINLPSGDVQSSVLGPLLFVLFIIDVSKILNDTHCFCKLYADDLKLYTSSYDNALYTYSLN